MKSFLDFYLIFRLKDPFECICVRVCRCVYVSPLASPSGRPPIRLVCSSTGLSQALSGHTRRPRPVVAPARGGVGVAILVYGFFLYEVDCKPDQFASHLYKAFPRVLYHAHHIHRAVRQGPGLSCRTGLGTQRLAEPPLL